MEYKYFISNYARKSTSEIIHTSYTVRKKDLSDEENLLFKVMMTSEGDIGIIPRVKLIEAQRILIELIEAKATASTYFQTQLKKIENFLK